MTVTESKCRHERLSFGSGAYYVICLGCMAYWKPMDEDVQRDRCVNNDLHYQQDVRAVKASPDEERARAVRLATTYEKANREEADRAGNGIPGPTQDMMRTLAMAAREIAHRVSSPEDWP